jgi:N-methylhydantoinase B
MGDHMPVHLGSMPMSVQAAIAAASICARRHCHSQRSLRGGTHLPDITMVLPVFLPEGRGSPAFYVSNRAHHADVGGRLRARWGRPTRFSGGHSHSAGADCARRAGRSRDADLILLNVRTPAEREGDLDAQIGAAAWASAHSEWPAKYGKKAEWSWSKSCSITPSGWCARSCAKCRRARIQRRRLAGRRWRDG